MKVGTVNEGNSIFFFIFVIQSSAMIINNPSLSSLRRNFPCNVSYDHFRLVRRKFHTFQKKSTVATTIWHSSGQYLNFYSHSQKETADYFKQKADYYKQTADPCKQIYVNKQLTYDKLSLTHFIM